MSNILLTGSAHGLGRELSIELRNAGHKIYAYDIENSKDITKPHIDYINALPSIDVLINNAAVNRIDWFEELSEESFDLVMNTNAKGIFLMTKALLPNLIGTKGTVLNIISNAAHLPMRCSLAYNASKGAAHIMTLQMARELFERYGITVFGVAPNKLKGTKMSQYIEDEVVRTRGWFVEEVRKYQLESLPIHEETEPEAVANFITFLLQDKIHHKYLHGCILPYGA